MTQHDTGARVGESVRRVAESDKLETAARAGYVVNGVMHLLIAFIALKVAWSSSGGQADQSGALALLAGNGLGKAVLWLGVVGFAGLALLALTQAAASARSGRSDRDQLVEVAKSVGKAVVYAVLAYSAGRFATGSGSSSSGQSKSFTAQLMTHTGGRVLVFLIGLAVIGVAGYSVYKGIKRKFLDELREHPGAVVERLAVAGYVARGVALAIVGLLFCSAAVQRKASEASGLDGALRKLRDQPLGPYVLTLVALGLAAYGLYSFARARYARL